MGCQLNSCRTRVLPSLPPRGLQISTLPQSLELPSILQNVLWKYPTEIVRYAPLWYVICMGEGGELGFYMRSENSSLDAYDKTELLQWQDAKYFGQRNYNEDIFSPWEQLYTFETFSDPAPYQVRVVSYWTESKHLLHFTNGVRSLKTDSRICCCKDIRTKVSTLYNLHICIVFH